MTNFRTSPLYQAVLDVYAAIDGADGSAYSAIDNLVQIKGLSIEDAVAHHIATLRGYAEKHRGYKGAKAATEAARFDALADALEAIEIGGDDAPASAGYVAMIAETGGLPIVLAYEGSDFAARREARRISKDQGLEGGIEIVRVESYDDRWHEYQDAAVLFGEGFAPDGGIAVPYGYRG